ncbi:MAG TPA: aminotransferase class V-fold PLP-dependent enzyme [Symbiobacteriaceae bacterium]|nr:aminotransferase class V-fold PLP-dependent enzyme [Symbiobacteriaceae bacterium]
MMQNLLQELFRRLRDHFPALDRENSGGYIFLDNAAGAQLPLVAIEQVTEHLSRRNAQKGPVFSRQERMQQIVYALRASVADLMGTAPERVALGLNATSLLSLVAHHLGRDLREGELILTSEMDHTANINPWEEMRSKGVRVEMVPVTEKGSIDMEAYSRLLEQKPRVVAHGWVSNATGNVADVKEMARLAHAAGAITVVDCVAGAPHLPMFVDDWDIDFAICSAYKLFGPHLGMLYANPRRLGGWALGDMISQDAGRYGLGTAYSAKLELGTQNHEGIAGFLGALAYLEMVGTAAAANLNTPAPRSRREKFLTAFDAIGRYEQQLLSTVRSVVDAMPGVTVYGTPAVPIVSFNLAGRAPADVARHLDARGIEARTGNYLAIPQMVKLARDYEGEAVRVSLLHYNTVTEVQRLAEALQSL